MMHRHAQPPDPRSPSPVKNKPALRETRHWSERVEESIVSFGLPEGLLSLLIQGGADSGQFCYIGDVRSDKIQYHTGKLHPDDIVLEIQGQKVTGYTLNDTLNWLKQVSRNAAPVMFKTVRSSKSNWFVQIQSCVSNVHSLVHCSL